MQHNNQVGMQEVEGSNLERFRSMHDEAYLYINQGITQEDPKIDRKDVALIMYQRGLGLLDMALCFDTEGGSDEHVKAQRMQHKMARTREHVHSRIVEITDILAPPVSSVGLRQTTLSREGPGRPPPPRSNSRQPPPRPSSPPPASSGDLPPSYSEVVGGQAVTGPSSYGGTRLSGHVSTAPRYRKGDDSVQIEIGREADLMEPAGGGLTRSSSWEEGLVIFSVPQVQIFSIKPNGEVSTPSYPEILHIVKFSRRREDKDLPPAFIELGSFTYPLVPGQSPILKADYGGYLLPDLESGIEGAAIGVILPDSITDQERNRLDQLLNELTKSSNDSTSFKTQAEVEEEYKEYKEFSGAFAEGIVKGAEIVGKGMVKGAVKTSELLFKGSDYAKQYMTPEHTQNIDPRVIKGLEIAQTVSSGACRVSGFLVSKIGLATLKLGRLAAPHLERQATRALTHFSGQSTAESSSQLQIAGELASGTLAAVSTLYMALENSSKILAKNIANNTVMIVAHKYGTDAAAATNNALTTAGNSYLTFYNTAALGPKGIAKRLAKDTGKAMIGFDPSEVNARASRAPDSDIDAKDLLESLSSRTKNGESENGAKMKGGKQNGGQYDGGKQNGGQQNPGDDDDLY